MFMMFVKIVYDKRFCIKRDETHNMPSVVKKYLKSFKKIAKK